jgi:CRISPR-associated protein Cas4
LASEGAVLSAGKKGTGAQAAAMASSARAVASNPPCTLSATSAVNQYACCPRRCALIYLDGEFQNTIYIERGNAEHDRVDRASHATSRQGARIEYALPIWSDRLGLIGQCDVVEFWPDATIYPVKYKHGRRKQHDNDDLQLGAQALRLEEMFSRPVVVGAIFHGASKRRRELAFDLDLRARLPCAAMRSGDLRLRFLFMRTDARLTVNRLRHGFVETRAAMINRLHGPSPRQKSSGAPAAFRRLPQKSGSMAARASRFRTSHRLASKRHSRSAPSRAEAAPGITH